LGRLGIQKKEDKISRHGANAPVLPKKSLAKPKKKEKKTSIL